MTKYKISIILETESIIDKYKLIDFITNRFKDNFDTIFLPLNKFELKIEDIKNENPKY